MKTADEKGCAELDARLKALTTSGVLGAGLAHELRNTLAAAESAIFLARRHAEEPSRLARHLDHAEAEVRRSQDMIGRVLSLARGEPLTREQTLLADIVAAVDRDFEDAHAELETTLGPPELEVLCEPLLLERVLTNLLRNAEEAGARRVLLRAYATSEAAIIEIEDDGPGISEAVAARLFEPLVTDKPTGTGLGLALSQIIVRAHGGSIEARKASAGGALFRIVLPGSE